jgi:hypothetical protein
MSISVLQRERELRQVQAKLAEQGIPVNLSDLSAANYSEVLTPILIGLFKDLSEPMVRIEIARKLALSSDRDAVEDLLLAAFEEGVSNNTLANDSYRWGLAGVLESIASKKSKNTNRYLEIAKDQNRFGKSREMIVLALAKLRGAGIEELLMHLLADEEVYGHAIIALGKRRAQKALPLIQRFETDRKPWVRKEAFKARTKIERES